MFFSLYGIFEFNERFHQKIKRIALQSADRIFLLLTFREISFIILSIDKKLTKSIAKSYKYAKVKYVQREDDRIREAQT